MLRYFSVTEIMFAGRWDSLRTLNHYLQEGLAAYAVSCLPQDRRELVQSLVELLPELALGQRQTGNLVCAAQWLGSSPRLTQAACRHTLALVTYALCADVLCSVVTAY